MTLSIYIAHLLIVIRYHIPQGLANHLSLEEDVKEGATPNKDKRAKNDNQVKRNTNIKIVKTGTWNELVKLCGPLYIQKNK